LKFRSFKIGDEALKHTLFLMPLMALDQLTTFKGLTENQFLVEANPIGRFIFNSFGFPLGSFVSFGFAFLMIYFVFRLYVNKWGWTSEAVYSVFAVIYFGALINNILQL